MNSCPLNEIDLVKKELIESSEKISHYEKESVSMQNEILELQSKLKSATTELSIEKDSLEAENLNFKSCSEKDSSLIKDLKKKIEDLEAELTDKNSSDYLEIINSLTSQINDLNKLLSHRKLQEIIKLLRKKELEENLYIQYPILPLKTMI